MGIYFGTDGIRGKVNDVLNFEVAFRCGNALASGNEKMLIVIGGDTRTTRSYLTNAFSCGAMAAGANLIDIGVCTTAGIAYITEKIGADYGTVVSASHNSAEYNGIKIFDAHGVKLGDERENALEKKFLHTTMAEHSKIGNYKQDFSLVKLYEDHLVNSCETNLSGLTILLDSSNGAAYKVAPAAFRRLGAKVIATHCKEDGANINNKCGSLYPENMAKLVKKYKADIGFSFDGDADRLIACDEKGEVVDGDIIIFILAKYLKDQGKLAKNIVVGTRHTNKGIEEDLNAAGITLVRTDIGDKYVIEKMENGNLNLGGEKSGHIILRDYATTGDGILSAIKLAEVLKVSSKKLSEIKQVNLYPQCNIDCKVDDKFKIINSELLNQEITKQEKLLGEGARIMVRVSGTEDKIRVMVECKDLLTATESAHSIAAVVHAINN